MVKRAIEPSDISQRQLDTEVKNELECVANNTLACIIQQLSSLSKHSEDLFGELYAETYTLATRTSNLCTRIEKLKHKIVQLNPTVEEVLLQEINLRKPFKSSVCRDQQIMVRSTRPFCINEAYMHCEAPPNLSELDAFREDGKSSLKFYTDPNYFVELWYSEIKAVQHQQKKPRHKHGQVHKTNKPKALRTPKNKIEEFKDFRHGPEFVENFRKEHSFRDTNISSNGVVVDAELYHGNEFTSDMEQQHIIAPNAFKEVNIRSSHPIRHSEEKNCISNVRSSSLAQVSSHRPMGPPPAPPKKEHHSGESQHLDTMSQLKNNSSIHPHLDETDGTSQMLSSKFRHFPEESFSGDNLPPPPPSPHRGFESFPPVDSYYQLPSPTKVAATDDSQMSPLPPPPPLPNSVLHEMFLAQPANDPKEEEDLPLAMNNLILLQPDQESLASNSSCSASVAETSKLNLQPDKAPLVRDTRSDLLAAIREGIQLRKVEEHRLKTEESKKAGPLDVQSIMEAAFEMRRKALEENDSDQEEEDDANWSD